ncbi:MAG: DNRLRE domain-containing protein [Planctomycetota bacterium]|nr:DNRLRE domain-containing protein [Planctomycetota bacterium]
MNRALVVTAVFLLPLSQFLLTADTPLPQSWDYVESMKKVAANFKGSAGVVLHIGDSITYSNPYGQWARGGSGKTADDTAVLRWMNVNAKNETDGWHLAAYDHPAGGRSYTACSGIRLDEMLQGGKRQMPPMADILTKYRPQMVVMMLGTNDVTGGRSVAAYEKDLQRAVKLVLDSGALLILSTIPPHFARLQASQDYNAVIRQIAKSNALPLIDFEKEILKRRPNDWNGTLLGENDVHPTASSHGTNANSAPTTENLRNSGYLLRGWLSVQKIAEVKRTVLDGMPLKVAEATEAAIPDAVAVKAPTGEKVKLEVTRDTWFSNVGSEATNNLGGATKLKVKSIQEMSLLDIDPASLKGRIINGATLHVRLAGNEILHRMTLSSFASEWYEGTSTSYQDQDGSSSHKSKRHPDVPWAQPGSDLCSVMLGKGNTIWRSADSFPPDEQRWQKFAVGVDVVAARVAGLSYGFLMFDDTGSEWTRNGESFNYRNFPNRFVYSREGGKQNAPYFTVFLGDEDKQPPGAPSGFKSDVKDLPAGEAWLFWNTPEDAGDAGTLGFHVKANGKEVPRYLVPIAGKTGETVKMHVRDLDLQPGQEVALAVRAVDRTGNVGPEATYSFKVSAKQVAQLPGQPPSMPTGEGAKLPRLGDAEIAIVDSVDKVHPVSGKMIPERTTSYLGSNHLWSAEDKRIRLYAARNEFVDFQILFKGMASDVRPELHFEQDKKVIRESFFEYRHVNSKQGFLPDPMVALTGGFSVPSSIEKIPDQAFGSLLCEVYVPHHAPAGELQGNLVLKSNAGTLDLAVTLTVWEFNLPDHLSFLPEMNCYSLPGNERDYYRLAHLHRTVLNRVPYSQSGNINDGCAPGWDGAKLNFRDWDRRFGQYFDGSAFDDLPRKGVPVECFYLPLHENWPSPMEGNYNGDYWADRAFPPSYRKAFVDASAQYAEHFKGMQWNDTLFHCYQNNKSNFKGNGWSKGSSPWLLDEPASFQDYWALRYFAEAFHEGVNRIEHNVKFAYRGDISRPMWQRDTFDHILDYNVVGGALRGYHRMVMDLAEERGQIVVDYGSANAIEDSNIMPIGWCIDSWTIGSNGNLPWQTIGRANSWKEADRLSLFYPGEYVGSREPIPSIRLKIWRRGQQLTEYFTLWKQLSNEPQWSIERAVRTELQLQTEARGTGFTGGEDAGVLHFTGLKPEAVWAMRLRLGNELSKLKPAPKKKLIDFRTPRRDLNRKSPGYVEVGELPDFAKAAGSEAVETKSQTKVLQGREFVRDTMIDAADAKPLGKVRRDNRLMRRSTTDNAFLVHFDLSKLDIKKSAKVKKATLSLFIWDPSSRGRAKTAAYLVKTAWDEISATWAEPGQGLKWQDGSFTLDKDTGQQSEFIVIEPDQGGDTVNPPLEYKFDVTEIASLWVSGKATNHGLAVASVVDRSIDEGNFTRNQVLASEYDEVKYTPKLEIEWGD